MSGLSNYPPGVTGNEPQITGEWPCADCGATLPEEGNCPECGEALEIPEGEWVCPACDFTRDGSVCPEGCSEDPAHGYDAQRDREMEMTDDDRREAAGY